MEEPEVPELAVTAIGADRPGIIARVTGVLLEHGGNLEDSSMTILGGQFAIMLLVSTDRPAEELRDALVAATEDLGLVVTVAPVGPGAQSRPPTHLLSVYGSDRPGIVHEVTSVLAEAGVNVTDLTTRVLDGERPVYAMMLEISLPDGVVEDEVTEAVLAGVHDVDASLHALDVATF
jgi:glycine cleavage system transcriptional repressor